MSFTFRRNYKKRIVVLRSPEDTWKRKNIGKTRFSNIMNLYYNIILFLCNAVNLKQYNYLEHVY